MVTYGSPLNEYLFNKHHDTWNHKGEKPHIEANKGDKLGQLRVSPVSPTKETNTKESSSAPFQGVVQYWHRAYEKKFGYKSGKRCFMKNKTYSLYYLISERKRQKIYWNILQLSKSKRHRDFKRKWVCEHQASFNETMDSQVFKWNCNSVNSVVKIFVQTD